MKKIFGCEDTIQCGFLKGVLENTGIPCLVRNEHLQGGTGEIPFVETWPELWVLEDEDAIPARRLVEDVLGAADADARSWECAGCSESNEPQFSTCWKCGADRYR